MNADTDHKLLQQCLAEIEEKLGWGPSAYWHSDVFVELSETIHKDTRILLSPTTLKRVWGKISYHSAPSISTLNALSQFAGYDNWRAFKQAAAVQLENPSANIKRQGKILVYASVIAVIFVSLFSVLGPKDRLAEFDFNAISFESRSVASGIPNTVVFDFDLKGLQSDSLLIQQFWDPTKTIRIRSDQTQATGQYYYPGFFRAKLLVEGQIVREHDLFIQSEGWLGTLDYTPIPKYIENPRSGGSTLSFSEAVIDEIISREEPLISAFHFVKDLKHISGDNFVLEASMRHLYLEKWAVCQKTVIVVVGTKSALIIPFSIPGCVSEIGVMLSETYLNGKEYDLSDLGVDLSDFRAVRLDVQNKVATVYVEDRQLFSHGFEKTIGDVVGVRFRFMGAGEVKDIQVSSGGRSLNLLNDIYE